MLRRILFFKFFLYIYIYMGIVEIYNIVSIFIIF